MLLKHMILAAIGGAFGSALRFGTGALMIQLLGRGWPWGTYAVNILGSLAMGLIMGWLAHKGSAGGSAQILVATGILGGFTTFSAFSLEAAMMIERKAYMSAGLYVGSSVLLGVLMVFAGLFFMRRVLM